MRLTKYILISLFLVSLPGIGYNLPLPQARLLDSLERSVVRLEEIKAKVPNETAQKEIAEEINWTKTKIEEVKQTDDPQELRSLFAEIRSHVQQKIKERQERLQQRPVMRTNIPFARGQEIISRLERTVAILKDKGYETTKLESLIEEFKNLSAESKEKFTAAKEKRDLEALKDSQDDLSRLRELIRQIIEEFKLIIK